jgi:hypothetical protein
MTTIGKAAQASLEFLKSVNPDVQDILVEEVVQKNSTVWLITLSYTPTINNQKNALAALSGIKRYYKIFEVEIYGNQDIGCVVKSMKIRDFSSAA